MSGGSPVSTPLRIRIAYGACFAVMAAALAVIAWKAPRLWRGEEQRRPISTAAVSSLLSKPLPLDAGRTLRLSDSSADFLVMFLFTPADCAACLPELEDLSDLARERPDLDVVAVIAFSNPDEARQTRENFGLQIPVVQDPDGILLKELAPPRTPWKVVIRRADRHVLFESPPDVSAEQRAAFLSRLRSLGQGTAGASPG